MKRARLRFMRESDLDAVLEIEKRSFASPWSRANFLYELHRNRTAVNWVIEVDDSLAGYACVWVLGPELRINNIAIRPELRRRGLAARFLEALLRRAANLGCEKAQLEVRPSNTAALALYRRFGFVEVGRRKDYYREEREDALMLEVELSATVANRGSPGV